MLAGGMGSSAEYTKVKSSSVFITRHLKWCWKEDKKDNMLLMTMMCGLSWCSYSSSSCSSVIIMHFLAYSAESIPSWWEHKSAHTSPHAPAEPLFEKSEVHKEKTKPLSLSLSFTFPMHTLNANCEKTLLNLLTWDKEHTHGCITL